MDISEDAALFTALYQIITSTTLNISQTQQDKLKDTAVPNSNICQISPLNFRDKKADQLARFSLCPIKPPPPVEDWTSFTFSLRDLHAWAVLCGTKASMEVLMDKNHLSHSTWDCKYHVVFGSKYRTKRLYGDLRTELRDQFVKLASQKGCHIEEGHLMADHVHMLISIPPKYSVAHIVGFLKGKTALFVANKYARKRRYKETTIQGLSLLGAWILRIDHGLQGGGRQTLYPQSGKQGQGI